MPKQSNNQRHRKLKQASRDLEKQYEEFKNQIASSMKKSDKVKHYSIFHNFDESMILN